MNKLLNIFSKKKSWKKNPNENNNRKTDYQISSKSTQNTQGKRAYTSMFDCNLKTCLCQSKLGLKLM